MLCLCHHRPALLRFWFHTNLGCKNSASYLEIQSGKTFSYQGHPLVMLYASNFYALIGQNLKGEYMLKIYAATWNLLNTLTAEADHARLLCQLIVMFLKFCLFPLNVQNEIQLLSRVFCYSWLVCLLVFWLRDVSLVKVRNLILDGMVFIFHLAWCKRGFKSLKWFWPYLIAFRSCILKIGKPE